ncbi:MAG: long-chain fatty acid--CoA ligase [Candidatus Poribacteria bacterium]|nr:long-chain fatty acid--CoA ligase [Candidatus Poribacteria bacterium]
MHGLMMNYPLTLAQILEHAHRIHGDKRITTRLSHQMFHRYSYTALYERVKQLANAITQLGIVQPGDRVATYASNTYQHLELYYAIPCLGAVLHPLNVRLSAAQLAHITHEAEDKVIFVDGAFAGQFEELRNEIKCEQVVYFNQMPTPSAVFYEQFLSEADPAYTWDIPDENWAMGLCYTSGTQGEPRGVLYTHRSMFLHTLAVNQADVFGLTEADVVLPLVPMFHAMAWGLPYASMFAGADLVLPGPTSLCLADLIAKTGVTVAAGVPTVWAAAYPEFRKRRRDIYSLRRLIVGGEAMPPTLIEAYEKELGIEICHAWGMTEMSPTGTFSKLRRRHQNLSDAEKWRVKAKQGRPVPGVELRIVAETSNQLTELPWDGKTAGELQVRSPWTASTYYGSKPTDEHFTPDGWLRTGDIATIDAQGYMQIVDRAKALIRSGGESISSVALETALLKHPYVLDAAVIGMPNEKWGERPLAVVALTPVSAVSNRTDADIALTPVGAVSNCTDADIALTPVGAVSNRTDADISNTLKQHLALEFPKFWIPDHFVFVDEIPKTGVGKSDKQTLRKRLLSAETKEKLP